MHDWTLGMGKHALYNNKYLSLSTHKTRQVLVRPPVVPHLQPEGVLVALVDALEHIEFLT